MTYYARSGPLENTVQLVGNTISNSQMFSGSDSSTIHPLRPYVASHNALYESTTATNRNTVVAAGQSLEHNRLSYVPALPINTTTTPFLSQQNSDRPTVMFKPGEAPSVYAEANSAIVAQLSQRSNVVQAPTYTTQHRQATSSQPINYAATYAPELLQSQLNIRSQRPSPPSGGTLVDSTAVPSLPSPVVPYMSGSITYSAYASASAIPSFTTAPSAIVDQTYPHLYPTTGPSSGASNPTTKVYDASRNLSNGVTPAVGGFFGADSVPHALVRPDQGGGATSTNLLSKANPTAPSTVVGKLSYPRSGLPPPGYLGLENGTSSNNASSTQQEAAPSHPQPQAPSITPVAPASTGPAEIPAARLHAVAQRPVSLTSPTRRKEGPCAGAAPTRLDPDAPAPLLPQQQPPPPREPPPPPPPPQT